MSNSSARRTSLSAAVMVFTSLMAAGAGAAVAETVSPWSEAYNSRTRLLAGSQNGKIHAGVVIEMAAGWKTYWRHPGDSGGVPPSFDWTASTNLMAATTLFPAPKRLTDPAGDAIGYKDRVVFPVRVVAADPGQPLKLAVQLEYGICKDICVPVEVRLQLDLPGSFAAGMPGELAAALEKVPRVAGARRAGDPSLVRTEARLEGQKPQLAFEVEYAGDSTDADAFVEAPDGIYVPQPKPVGPSTGLRRSYTIDLSSGVDPMDLRGKRLTLTLVGATGQTQASWQLD